MTWRPGGCGCGISSRSSTATRTHGCGGMGPGRSGRPRWSWGTVGARTEGIQRSIADRPGKPMPLVDGRLRCCTAGPEPACFALLRQRFGVRVPGGALPRTTSSRHPKRIKLRGSCSRSRRPCSVCVPSPPGTGRPAGPEAPCRPRGTGGRSGRVRSSPRCAPPWPRRPWARPRPRSTAPPPCAEDRRGRSGTSPAARIAGSHTFTRKLEGRSTRPCRR